MRTRQIRKGAVHRYLNALKYLHSNVESIYNMAEITRRFNIASTFGRMTREYNYVKKINGVYVYLKPDAPTLQDAHFILIKINAWKRELAQMNYKAEQGNQLNLEYIPRTEVKHDIKSLPKPVVKKRVKIEKQPNVWMYIAVISMFTTLVTIALVLFR